ncbi:Cytochrome c' [Defluviimonas aquaemixtae]|uniref:Cytochrome c n=1 Tax=Albidovulum aquaemixtae TaxID=1542388 RepID=A0A2R8B5C3_9RHOB|nr:cytochrome c [Defluviimonas aquaemixtae]SPH17777.1 Cytochrome c' [Defluviimonas aquaemixtae]
MKKVLVGTTIAMIALAGSVSAQDSGPFGMQIKARQGIMSYRALNIGVLGAMAKGEAEYDAAAAQTAADNLVASAMLDASMLWPEGSDNSANPMSTADAKAWTAEAKVGEKGEAFVTAAKAMQSAAGGGLDAVKEAMGPLGEACGDCHKAARIPKE